MGRKLGLILAILVIGGSLYFIQGNNHSNEADLKAVNAYILKAKSHLMTAPNYQAEIHDELLLEMANETFDLSREELKDIYVTSENE